MLDPRSFRGLRGPGRAERPPSGSRRRIVSFANYEHDATPPVRLAILVHAGDRGYLTHVVVGLVHLDWFDRERKRGEWQLQP